jgi:hypothetical protein
MKVYMLIPLHNIKDVKVKERDHRAARVMLTSDYSECFGKENEYYIDWASRVCKAEGWKTVSYKNGNFTWFYTALNPQDMIRRRIIKEVKA